MSCPTCHGHGCVTTTNKGGLVDIPCPQCGIIKVKVKKDERKN